jgi:hypothetical protein
MPRFADLESELATPLRCLVQAYRMPMVEACSELKSVHQAQQQSTATTLPNTDTHPALKCSDQHNHHSVQPPR